MIADMECARVRDLASEVALGIAVGEDRDLAIRHLATCQDCQRVVSDLSTLGDELLLLAPQEEPPRGFADRVVAGLARTPRRPRRWVTALAAAAAIVVATAIGAGAVLQATSSDRQLAESYRALLDRAGGSSFLVTPLEGPDGRVGTLFAYEGKPSWVYVTMDEPTAQQWVRVELVVRNGTPDGLGQAILGGEATAWGAAVPVALGQVRAVRFLAADGSVAFEARLDSPAAVSAGWELRGRG